MTRIFVYQAGRSGSHTVTASLEAADPGAELVHIHYLGDHCLNFFRSFDQPAVGPELRAMCRDIVATGLSSRGDLACERRRPRLVCTIREPLSLMASAFFYNLDFLVPEDGPDHAGRVADAYRRFLRMAAGELQPESPLDTFAGHFHWMPLQWFDVEFRPMTGIDVYRWRFEPARAWEIVRERPLAACILRFEDLDRVLAPAMRSFLTLPEVALVPHRLSNESRHYPLYQRLVREICPGETLIAAAYDSRFARHFYSAEERALLAERWRRGDGPTGIGRW
jgi:hypothetical protein